MDLKSGLPYWLIKDGLPFNYPTLTQSVTTRVVVLGAGISGALMAYHLGNAGIETVVIDKRSIGLGSTCASTSLLQYEIDKPLSELIEKRGYKDAVRSYRLCSASIDKLGAIAKHIGYKDFEYKNSLFYAVHKKDVEFLEREFSVRKKAGFEVEWLNEKEISNNYLKAPAAILSHQAAQTNAYGFAHALHQFNVKKGIDVYDRTEIIDIRHQPRSVELITSDGIKIKCKKLVYATGYEVVNMIDKKIVDLQSTYAVISELFCNPDPFWPANALIWNTADPYLYMRVTADNRIIVGGRDEKFYNPKRRDKLIKNKTRQLAGDFTKLFPQHVFKPEFSWTGTFGATEDGLPFIGTYKKLPNSYFSLGFGGNGITFSLIAAEIITSLLQGKNNQDSKIFSFDRV